MEQRNIHIIRPVDVGVIEGGEGLVVHDDDISGGSGFQYAQLGVKVLRTDESVVLEEHVGDFAPAYIGQARILTLCGESYLDGLQHVVGVSVGTHAQEDAGLVQGQNGAGAYCITHVGFGVIDHHGVGVLNDLDLGGIDVDAVTQDGLGSQNAVILETLYGTAAVVLQAVIYVVHSLGNMDVIAGSAVVGLYHPLKGLVGNGEEGMTAEHSGKHGILLLLAVGDEVCVLLDGLEALFLAVTVRDLVTQAGTDAEFLGGLGDLEEAAGDLTVGSVMVKDGGDTLFDAVDIQSIRRSLGACQHQLAVNGPPGSVQNLVEVGGVVALDTQTAGQGGVDVGMGIDESGHNYATLGINELCLRILGTELGSGAGLQDLGAVDDNTAVRQIGVGLTPGNESTVGKNVHRIYLLWIKKNGDGEPI